MRRPLRPCSFPGCSALVISGRCTKHQAADKVKVREYNRQRYQETGHLYGNEWKKARKAWLMEHPLCAECERQGRVTPATIVDHIRPHKGDLSLFWDTGNWESLCKHHHDAKTAREDNGFGNQSNTSR